jgi:hypothetical protein
MTARQPEDRRKDGRAERLAAALKQNLKRRKAQARGRQESENRNQASGNRIQGTVSKKPYS